MKKWLVEVEIVVAAPTRKKAWDVSRAFVEEHIPTATVLSVDMEPLPNPEEWKAVNEEPARPSLRR